MAIPRSTRKTHQVQELTGQSQLRMSFDRGNYSSEHSCRHYVYFIKQDETPFSGSQEVHHLLGRGRSIARIGYHRVRADDNTALAGKGFLRLGCKDGYLLLIDIRPLHEFAFPLHDGHPKQKN